MSQKFQTAASRDAASRALDFLFGWFADPVVFGDYPQNLKSSVGNRLPQFSEMQSRLLKGSFDFFGLNYYTTQYAEPAPLASALNASYSRDKHVTTTMFDKVSRRGGWKNGKIPTKESEGDPPQKTQTEKMGAKVTICMDGTHRGCHA